MRKDEAKSILLKTIPCPYKDNEKICHHLQEGGGDCESCYEEALDTILNLVETLEGKIKSLQYWVEELKKENKEIRDWKYVIDNPIDLDKLKELDIIKIKGKEYISKSIYNELEKDKKALVNNYSNVLGEFIPKDKIREKIKEYDKWIKEGGDYTESLEAQRYALKELLEENTNE